MPLKHYILDENHEIKVVDLETWAKWFENAHEARRVKRTVYNGVNDNEIVISTVFLGLDHNFFDEGPPILFETMVFGGLLDQETERYATWNQAVRGHDQMVRKVLSTEPGLSIDSSTSKPATTDST